MKKKFFFMAVAAIALASCSSEDVVEPNNGNAIDFRVAMGGDANARSTETTTSNLGQFKVTAFANGETYFSELLFKQDGNTTTYYSDPTYYWPSTHTVDFYAYSYYTGVNNGSLNALGGMLKVDDGAKTITGFTPDPEIANQIDPVTAYAQGNRADNEGVGVSLNFKHMLSQIQIKAKSNNTVYKFEIKAAKIANVKSVGGTWNINPGQWTSNPTDNASYTLNLAKTVTLTSEAADIMTDTNAAMLLPQTLKAWDTTADDIEQGTYLAVLLRITTTANSALVYPEASNVEGEKGNEFGWALVPINTTWKSNYRYVYTLDFSTGAGYDENGDPILGGPIYCIASASEWAPDPEFNGDTDMQTWEEPSTAK